MTAATTVSAAQLTRTVSVIDAQHQLLALNAARFGPQPTSAPSAATQLASSDD